MSEKIAILLPTRMRPERLTTFWKSVVSTVSDIENVKLYLYIDDDDPKTIEKADELKEEYGDRIFALVKPRIIMSQMVNELYPHVEEDILFFGADDLLMRTSNWDKVIIEFFTQVPDRIALVYGNDLAQTERMHLSDPNRFATHPIVHKNWVKALGYLSPPYFSCDYADTWINDLANGVGRSFPLPFVNEHMHFTVKKAKMDQTYLENRQRFNRDRVPTIYREKQEELKSDISKLASFIRSFSEGASHE
tara:strand:- start:327 stop:1073 length:747 start_codon:yes stop_codon:yes gene_type:complete